MPTAADIQTLPVERLQPAPYNPRVELRPGSPEWRRLKRSLAEFGLVQPIVWNEQTGHVVGGHQRLEVLKHAGETEVSVCVVSLSLDREKALNVALNNSLVAGDWDPDKLVELMAELSDLPDFDATLTGFDPVDIQDLLLAPQPAPAEPAGVEEPPVVRAVIEVPPENWEAVRAELDPVIAGNNLTIHVQLPG